MSFRIQSNVDAMASADNLARTQTAVSKSIQRLSTGFRINSAADDAAGLSISERMRGQIRGIAQATKNANDGISMLQTGEGALNGVHDMLQRVRELAVEYHNGSLSTADRTAIQSEVNQLASEIQRVGTQTSFNGTALLNAAAPLTLQIGANDGETLTVQSISLGATVGTAAFSLSIPGTSDMANIDAAIGAISDARASFGSVQNRMTYTLNSLNTYNENLTAAESQIRDVDVASEMATYTKNQILSQAGTAMLAQANQENQGVLKLLQ